MIYSYPDYYKKFRCIADKCPDTCCSDWQIVIDDESLEKISELRRRIQADTSPEYTLGRRRVRT